MLEFNTINLSDDKLDTWTESEQNVCLIGKHGSGKTTTIISAFKRKNWKWKYFSGATLDPWIHILGVPNVSEQEGKKVLDFVLPPDMDDNLEAIFCDEYNRTHKTVRNALLELVQFKSINGRKFPKLKVVWIAVNPDKQGEEEDAGQYDVEEIDYAQLDRFHIIVKISDTPNRSYFYDKFREKGDVIINWYKNQSNEAKCFVSSRRLEYVLEAYLKGINIRDMLPVQCNSAELVTALGKDTDTINYEIALGKKNKKALGKLLSNVSVWEKFKPDITKRRCWSLLENVNEEILSTYINECSAFKHYVFINREKEEFCKKLHKDVSAIHKDTFVHLTTSKTDHNLIKEIQKGLKQIPIGEAQQDWRWKRTLVNPNDWSSANTNDKRTCYKFARQCIHDIGNANELQAFANLLSGINKCHEKTILTFDYLVEFVQIVSGYANQFGVDIKSILQIDNILELLNQKKLVSKVITPTPIAFDLANKGLINPGDIPDTQVLEDPDGEVAIIDWKGLTSIPNKWTGV